MILFELNTSGVQTLPGASAVYTDPSVAIDAVPADPSDDYIIQETSGAEYIQTSSISWNKSNTNKKSITIQGTAKTGGTKFSVDGKAFSLISVHQSPLKIYDVELLIENSTNSGAYALKLSSVASGNDNIEVKRISIVANSVTGSDEISFYSNDVGIDIDDVDIHLDACSASFHTCIDIRPQLGTLSSINNVDIIFINAPSTTSGVYINGDGAVEGSNISSESDGDGFGFRTSDATDINISDITVKNVTTGLSLGGDNAGTIDGVLVENVSNGISANTSSGPLTVKNVECDGVTSKALQSYGTGQLVFENMNFCNTNYAYVHSVDTGASVIVRDSTFSSTSYSIWLANNVESELLVEGSTFEGGSYALWDAHGSSIKHDVTVRDSVFHNCGYFYIRNTTEPMNIERCTFYHDTVSPAAAIYCNDSPLSAHTIKNCLFYNLVSGVYLRSEQVVTRCTILHCTFADCTDDITGKFFKDGVLIAKNNIFHAVDDAFDFGEPDDYLGFSDVDYNTFQVGLSVGEFGSNHYDDLPSWQALNSNDTNSQEVGELFFEDQVNDDYHITLSSPAFDFCPDIGIYNDRDNEARPYYNGFDCGCYELVFEETPAQPQIDKKQNATFWLTLEDTRSSGDDRNIRVDLDYVRML